MGPVYQDTTCFLKNTLSRQHIWYYGCRKL